MFTKLVDRVATRVIGSVAAGACTTDHGCCCKGSSHPHYLLNCLGTKCQYISSGRCNGPCGG
jgi:hypothetical protein